MKTATLSALLLYALSSSSEEIKFAPSEGFELTKTFSVERNMTVDTCDLAIDDNEFPVSAGLEQSSSFSLVVSDNYEKLEDGAVLALLRTFETVQREFANTNVPDNLRITELGDVTDPMEGFTVRFDWDDDAGEHVASFADVDDEEDEPDEAWLEGLTFDLDLAGFLPENEVAVGDTWDVLPDALAALLRPGGAFTWGEDESDDGPDDDTFRILLPGVADHQYYEALEGDVQAKLVSADEGRFVIEIEFALEAERDLREHLADTMMSDETTERVFSEAEGTLGIGGTAELIWSAERGTFVSFKFEADLENSLDASWTNSRVVEGEVELSLYSEESGTLVFEANTGS